MTAGQPNAFAGTTFAMPATDISALKPQQNTKAIILKLRFFDNNFKNYDVPDPWYGGKKDFENVFKIVNESCQNFYK